LHLTSTTRGRICIAIKDDPRTVRLMSIMASLEPTVDLMTTLVTKLGLARDRPVTTRHGSMSTSTVMRDPAKITKTFRPFPVPRPTMSTKRTGIW
jgi:hypothetical protein